MKDVRLRIAFATNLTTQESLPVFQKLHGSPHADLVHVFFYDTLASGRTSLLRVVNELGWKQLLLKVHSVGVQKLRHWMCRLFPSIQLSPHSAYELARNQQIPHSVVKTLNSKSVQRTLRSLDLDVLLVCVCKNILKPTTIEIPRYATINIHPSLLPRYRGPTPIFWMLYEGQTRGGVTFQKMTSQIDLGPIVHQLEVDIDPNQPESHVSRQLFDLAASHVDQVLSKVTIDNLHVQTLDAGAIEPKYYGYPTPAQRHELKLRQRSRSRTAV